MTHGLMPWGRLLDRFVTAEWDDFPTLGEWCPSMDISETKDNLVVRVEVPGMDQKDIRISLHENLLTITGEKRQENDEMEERYHRVERAYGAFTRGVRLPVAVDGGKVVATFKNGLLSVALPKTAAARGTTIPIRGE